MLSRFYAAHPDIVVHIEAFEDGVELGASDIDLAIRYGPANDADTTLFADRYIAVAKTVSETSGPAPTLEALTGRPLLAFKWKNAALDAPTWHRWLRAADYPTDFDFQVAWYSEETLAFHAAEQGLGALLCGDILTADAIEAGRMQRIDGPALPGFAYRLIQPPETERTRAARRFTAWLRDEAVGFQPPG